VSSLPALQQPDPHAVGVSSRKGRERPVLVGEMRLKYTERDLETARVVSSQVRERISGCR
jgi:hypothetical protein